jgi:hypothetical protein
VPTQALPLVAAQTPQPQSSAPQPKTEADQRGTKQIPFVVEAVESQSDAAEKQAARDHREQEATNSRITRNITAGLFLVALLQAGFFVWQLRMMRKNVRDTGIAATAAERSAEIAEKAMVSSQRAFIRVELERINIGTTHTTEVVLRVLNDGQTPAYQVTTCSWVDLRPFPHLPNGVFTGPMATGPISKSVIHPKCAIRNKTGTAVPLTQDAVAAIATGDSMRLYVYGHTNYKDAFGHDRLTNFCLAIKVAPNQVADTAYCDQHNEAT